METQSSPSFFPPLAPTLSLSSYCILILGHSEVLSCHFIAFLQKFVNFRLSMLICGVTIIEHSSRKSSLWFYSHMHLFSSFLSFLPICFGQGLFLWDKPAVLLSLKRFLFFCFFRFYPSTQSGIFMSALKNSSTHSAIKGKKQDKTSENHYLFTWLKSFVCLNKTFGDKKELNCVISILY